MQMQKTRLKHCSIMETKQIKQGADLREKRDIIQKQLNELVNEVEALNGCFVLIKEFNEPNQKFNIGLVLNINSLNV